MLEFCILGGFVTLADSAHVSISLGMAWFPGIGDQGGCGHGYGPVEALGMVQFPVEHKTERFT